MGLTALLIASAAPRYICTTSLIPTERKKKTRSSRKERVLCAKVLPASYTSATQLPDPQHVASFLCRQKIGSLYWNAHWLQYRKFSVLT